MYSNTPLQDDRTYGDPGSVVALAADPAAYRDLFPAAPPGLAITSSYAPIPASWTLSVRWAEGTHTRVTDVQFVGGKRVSRTERSEARPDAG